MEQVAQRVSEHRVALTMPTDELDALNAYCADRRRATGEPTARADVIRQAIRDLVEGDG